MVHCLGGTRLSKDTLRCRRAIPDRDVQLPAGRKQQSLRRDTPSPSHKTRRQKGTGNGHTGAFLAPNRPFYTPPISDPRSPPSSSARTTPVCTRSPTSFPTSFRTEGSKTRSTRHPTRRTQESARKPRARKLDAHASCHPSASRPRETDAQRSVAGAPVDIARVSAIFHAPELRSRRHLLQRSFPRSDKILIQRRCRVRSPVFVPVVFDPGHATTIID